MWASSESVPVTKNQTNKTKPDHNVRFCGRKPEQFKTWTLWDLSESIIFNTDSHLFKTDNQKKVENIPLKLLNIQMKRYLDGPFFWNPILLTKLMRPPVAPLAPYDRLRRLLHLLYHTSRHKSAADNKSDFSTGYNYRNFQAKFGPQSGRRTDSNCVKSMERILRNKLWIFNQEIYCITSFILQKVKNLWLERQNKKIKQLHF